ncbi:MAG: hypothetical protein OXE50_13040 [Chloroflexi bacterium]|nr:hypothetical protein [Chloroflexota bacterium]
MSTDMVRNNLDDRHVETAGEYVLRMATVFDAVVKDAMANHISEGDVDVSELMQSAIAWAHVGKIAECFKSALGQYMEMPREVSSYTEDSSKKIANRLDTIMRADRDCISEHEHFVAYLDNTQMKRSVAQSVEQPSIGFKPR